VKDRYTLPTLACFTFAWFSSASAAELELPSFSEAREHATESVDITLGSLPLFFMRSLMNDDDPEGAEAKAVLKGLKSVHVRSYRFADDFSYSKADIDALRSQLQKPGWSAVTQVHDRKQNEDVDIFVALEKEKITSLALIASKPRELTVVYIVGSIDPKQLGKLAGPLQIP
jgi:hypothetical protein